jgi:hypothetical protein
MRRPQTEDPLPLFHVALDLLHATADGRQTADILGKLRDERRDAGGVIQTLLVSAAFLGAALQRVTGQPCIEMVDEIGRILEIEAAFSDCEV